MLVNTLVADQPEMNNAGRCDQIRRLWPARRHRITPSERALIGTQGKAFTLLVTALQARGNLDVEDFASTLGVFSVVVAEEGCAGRRHSGSVAGTM